MGFSHRKRSTNPTPRRSRRRHSLRRQVGRQRGVDLLGRGGLGQFAEQVAQVAVGFVAVGLGGFDQRVESGRGGGTGGGVGEQPVAAADDKGPDRALAGVVIDPKAPVVEVADELRPLVVQVGERLAGEG
jgi:hypothetical protein